MHVTGRQELGFTAVLSMLVEFGLHVLSASWRSHKHSGVRAQRLSFSHKSTGAETAD